MTFIYLKLHFLFSKKPNGTLEIRLTATGLCIFDLQITLPRVEARFCQILKNNRTILIFSFYPNIRNPVRLSARERDRYPKNYFCDRINLQNATAGPETVNVYAVRKHKLPVVGVSSGEDTNGRVCVRASECGRLATASYADSV